jgi:hypothetical protein
MWPGPLQWVERWFTAPEPAAAGRMGLFRILFGLFYLWHLSLFDVSLVADLPADYRSSPVLLFDRLSIDPSRLQLRLLDGVLVAALVLLVVGLRTRAVTGVILVAGLLREALLAGTNVENGNVFLVFYLPLFFLAVGTWGDTYSLDAALLRRRGGSTVDAADDSWLHFLPARASLVVLVALFTSAPLFKTLRGGTWLREPDLLANLILSRNRVLAELGLPPNPLAPWIADHPPAGYVLQLGVLAFEGLFFLALFGRDLRNLFVASALVFHCLNAFFLAVTFTPVLITYGLFVDWEGLRRRVRPRPLPLPQAPAAYAIAALVAAVLLALTWRAGADALFNLGGLLDWRTMWLPVLPLALLWAGRSAARLVRAARGAWAARRVQQGIEPRSVVT